MLYIPRYLPSQVYFLLTRRPKQIPIIIEAPQQELDLRKYQEKGTEDIKKYINLLLEDLEYGESLKEWIATQNLKPEEFVSKVAEKSDTNFMYVKYVVPAIARGFYEDLNLDRLPQGLEQYYTDHWVRMGMTARPKPRVKLDIIYTLAELRTPVSSEVLARISRGPEDTVLDILDEWEEFLKSQYLDELTCYSVYHTSFNDFLQRKITLEQSQVSLKEINRRIVEYLDELMEDDEDEEIDEDG